MIVTSALHARSISDYNNDDDIEAAVRESWPSAMPATTRRRASTPSRLPQDVALETASSDYSPKDKADNNDNDDSESGTSSPMTVEDELRRLKALKAFQILEPTATPCRSNGDDDDNVLSSCMSPSLNDGIVHVKPSPPPNNRAPAEEEAAAAIDLRSTISTMERLVDMATRMFQVPIAAISVTDLGRQKILASKGLGGDDDNNHGKKISELPRHLSTCAQFVVGKEDALVLPNALGHELVRDTPIKDAQFYAAVPLITPEGERIGAMCIIDTTKPRPQGLSLLELQDLQHLAALAMQSLVERRSRLILARKLQKATRVVSATVHDLLTPLTAVELALSLLHEDQDFQGKLSQHQKESVKIASNCIGVLGRMCRRMRDQHSASCKRQVNGHTTNSTATTSCNKYVGDAHHSGPASLQFSNADFGLTAESFRIMYGTGGDDSWDGIPSRSNDDDSSTLFETKVLAAPRATVGIQDLVKSIHMAMDAIPKTIPIAIALHASVPSQIVTDDLKVLRCALNLLQHCASVATSGSIQLTIKAQYCRCGKEMLGFHCQLRPEDNGATTTGDLTCIHECCSTSRADFDSSESSSSSSLSVPDHHICCHTSGHLLKHSLRSCAEINLYSVAMQMDAIGGDCGIENAGNPAGESFWFRVPLEEPEPAATVAQITSLSSRNEPKAMLIDTCCVAESDTTKNREQTLVANDDSIALVLEAQPRKRRALIIEDSIVIRKVIANALAKIGIEAETAVNGMEGLHHLQGSVYDVVLCDFLMPVMDGLDCVKQYREWEKAHRPFIHQYIIGMSAHASEQDVERGIRAGMDCYKPKPLTYKGLKDIVDACEKNQQNLISQKLDDRGGNPVSKKSSGQTSRTMEVKSSERVQPKMCLIASKDECYDLARLTEARGWKSLIVHDGEDALQALKKRNWDAVLLDEKLPLLSGRRCVNEFREWEKENRVNSQTDMYILITSKKDEDMECRIQVPSGANGVVRKPIRPKEFEHILLKAEEPSLNIIMR